MRPRGVVRLFEHKQLLWESDNIFVNAGLPVLANLIAGVTAGQSVSAVGFGSGSVTPTVNDTSLSLGPTYYNSVVGHSFPTSGSVQFNYSLLTTDYGAANIVIQELGLFANATSVQLPAVQGSTNSIWSAHASVGAGSLIIDANGNLQLCSVSGVTGAAMPVWATSLNATTVDNSVSWTLVAFHEAPTPLIAHVTVPSFTYTGGGNYSGTWTMTF
jgi:hypothetical protein